MPIYDILKETTPGEFTDTKQNFTGTADEAQAKVAELQAADPKGACYAMQQMTP